MNLHELRAFIMARDVEDFHVISSGPLFHSAFTVLFPGGSKDGHLADVTTHDTRLVCIDDVDVCIEWGFPANNRDEEHHPWAIDARFSDPDVRTYLVDVFYRGSLVDREYVCAVDGHRAILPAPSARRVIDGPFMENEPIAWRATQWETALARIVNGPRREFDRYLQRSGILVEPA